MNIFSNLSAKTISATLTSLFTSLIVFVLTNYVPYFHHNLPSTLTPLIQAVAASLGAFAGAYYVKHEATIDEILRAFEKADSLAAIRDKHSSKVLVPAKSETVWLKSATSAPVAPATISAEAPETPVQESGD